MEKSSEMSHLQLLKSEVDEDLHKASSNLAFLMQKVRQIDHIIIGGPQEIKANKTFEIEKVRDDLMLIKSMLHQFNVVCKNRRDALKSDKVPIDDKWIHYPQYPIPDFTSYPVGCRIKGAISHIKDENKGIFYLMDLGRSAGFSSVYRLLQNKTDFKRINDLRTVESGDLIALQVNKEVTRALVEVSKGSFNFYFIDMGEEAEYDDQMELYQMAQYYKYLPALALLCNCDGLSKSGLASHFLRENLHEEVEVEVLKVKYNTLHVKFVDPIMEELFEDPIMEELLEDPVLDNSDNRSEDTIKTNTNPFLSDLYADMKISEEVKVKEELNNNNNGNDMDDLLDDEQTETSNAMVAVMGYDPKDEARYCKFYNEEEGGCFKGASCTFIHQKPLENGWTRDQIPTVVGMREVLPVPAIYQRIKIEMCFVNDIDSFYGYILDPEFHRNSAMSLNALNREINTPDNMKKYKKFKYILPCDGELVIAPYDGQYYRARVISVNDINVEVFFVDYGNYSEVPIKDLFVWDPLFGQIPIQAVQFRVAGIKPNKEKVTHLRANELFKHLNKKNIVGIVLDNAPGILVRLFDDKHELLDKLKESGLAVSSDDLTFEAKPEFVPLM